MSHADRPAAPSGTAGGAATIRALTHDDLSACSDVFYASLDALSAERRSRPWPRNPDNVRRLYGRLLASHPPGGAIAEIDGRAVGFGIAVERERSWFLGFLFVRPEQQGAGLGRALLERILPAGGSAAWLSAGGVMATCAEAIQPVSTGLYASVGMRPRQPMYLLVGRLRPSRLRRLSRTLVADVFEAVEDERPDGAEALGEWLAELDMAALGHRRAIDHRDDRAEGRQGVLYQERRTGRAVGYGYVQPSGRLGPVYAADPAMLESIVGDLAGRLPSVETWQLSVPGRSAALPGLLRAGLRFDEPPIVYCATADAIDGEGYLLRSFALP